LEFQERSCQKNHVMENNLILYTEVIFDIEDAKEVRPGP
jgi:hypothetical protein